MAKLEGRDPSVGSRWFTVSPVESAQLGTDSTDFVFEMWPGPDGVVWRRTFSTAGWFTGQDDVWALARAFVETPALLEARLPINLFRTNGGMPAKLWISAHWLQVAIIGNKSLRSITAVLFVQEGPEVDLFRRYALRTDVEQAERFGRELEHEVITSCPKWAASMKLS